MSQTKTMGTFKLEVMTYILLHPICKYQACNKSLVSYTKQNCLNLFLIIVLFQ